MEFWKENGLFEWRHLENLNVARFLVLCCGSERTAWDNGRQLWWLWHESGDQLHSRRPTVSPNRPGLSFQREMFWFAILNDIPYNEQRGQNDIVKKCELGLMLSLGKYHPEGPFGCFRKAAQLSEVVGRPGLAKNYCWPVFIVAQLCVVVWSWWHLGIAVRGKDDKRVRVMSPLPCGRED